MPNINKIIIQDLELNVSIGIYDHEKIAPQPIIIALETNYMDGTAFDSDEISSTLNYEKIIKTIKNCCAEKHYNLIETLAEDITRLILAMPEIDFVKIKLSKPGVLKNEKSGLLSVELERHKK